MSKDNQNDNETLTAKALPSSSGSLSTWSKRYRIVQDEFAGYEVQAWRIWWPFWMEIGTNTHCDIKGAEDFAAKQGVVKYL